MLEGKTLAEGEPGAKGAGLPSWTTNAIAMRSGDMAMILTDDRIDFGLIRPVPRDLDIYDFGISHEMIRAAEARRRGDLDGMLDAVAAVKANSFVVDLCDMRYSSPDEIADYGERYLSNLERYGHIDKYSWRKQYWGTRWNAETELVARVGGFSVAVFRTAGLRASRELMLDLATCCGSTLIHEWVEGNQDLIGAEKLGPDGLWKSVPSVLLTDRVDASPRMSTDLDAHDWAEEDLLRVVLA